jgi:hypothetical protein
MEMDDPIKEGRLKILGISKRLLIDIFNWWRDPPNWLALPITDELPADCVVVSVSVSWERQCIEAVVASREFPPCEDGAMMPRVPELLTEFRIVPFKSGLVYPHMEKGCGNG